MLIPIATISIREKEIHANLTQHWQSIYYDIPENEQFIYTNQAHNLQTYSIIL